ncbi:MAG TPA: helix-turn-helix domain-containing protein [Chloroflexia bacterium]|nr:helix-turn-helix domain-containing protein [Chloroflexia bacterium]
MPDQNTTPDYPLEEALELTTAEQLKALADPTRQRILGLVGQRAASTKQLSEMLSMPKGTVGHHLKALESAGLVRVVRARQVRAITEKYYGRVARVFRVSSDGGLGGGEGIALSKDVATMPLRQALAEVVLSNDKDDPTTFVISHARIPKSRAREFALRLEAISQEFGVQAAPGEKVFGLVAGVYQTDWRGE